MDFMQWMERRYLRPVVVVDSSPAVESACQRNGLDLVQLLRPFAVYNGTLYAHTGERNDSVAVRNFGVRLTRSECVREVGGSAIVRHEHRVLRKAAPMDLAYGEQLDRVLVEMLDRQQRGGPAPRPVQLSSASAAATLLERTNPPWQSTFLRDYHYLVRCSYFDTVDHPVGIICAASTSEVGGVEGMLQVFRSQTRRVGELRVDLPGMDAEMHQYFLLVHDITKAGGPTLVEARRMLAAAQQLYGPNYCALIKINSVANAQEVKSMDPSPWIDANEPCYDVPSAIATEAAAQAAAQAAAAAGTATASPGSSSVSRPDSASPQLPGLRFHRVRTIFDKWEDGTSKVTGCCLSPENVTDLRDVMSYYLAQGLFKSVERRLRVLSVAVQERRTTTLGKMAAWFKGKDEVKPKMEVVFSANSSVPAKYMASSLEMQMRRCGDLCLALQDFESAVSYYKMCRDELLETVGQRSFNRPMIAACQEAVGVAEFFQGKLILPSLSPWYTGGTASAAHRTGNTCRWELAQNDYVNAGAQTYALRLSLLQYEYCRTRTPPALSRAKAALEHVLRSGLIANSKLFSGVVYDLLAGVALFSNPPYPAGMMVPPGMPNSYPVQAYLRCFVRLTVEAGLRYSDDGALEAALRCFLRALEVFRPLGQRGCWSRTYEHILTMVAHLYFKLGQDVKGLVTLSTAVAEGTPSYSNRESGLRHFQSFWQQQQDVLSGMGYTLSPHMPIPCLRRSSFRIVRNRYALDATTAAEVKLVSETAAEEEWSGMEDLLRRHFSKEVAQPDGATFHFPKFRGNRKPDYLFRGGSPGKGSPSLSGATASLPTQDGKGHRHYTVPKTESLMLSFAMYNPVGGALTATQLSILYMSKNKPDQLWKSAATKTVTLEPGETQQVSLAFEPLEEGDYVIIGLCWSLLGQEGYYYFSTKEGRPGCAESVYEYAIENPTPVMDAEDNVWVTVTAPLARLTASFDPPLPSRMRDGEYFHTTLVVKNHSPLRDAAHVTLQRSPHNAHLLWFERFGLTHNLQDDKAFLVTECLKASSSVSLPVTMRAQHNHGDASQSCSNSVFLLLGFLPDAAALAQTVAGMSLSSSVPVSTVPPSPPPPSLTGLPAEAGWRGPAGSSSSPISMSPAPQGSFHPHMVRLHRLLRRVEVRPMMVLYSTVLPPANASLATAAVVTAKYIADPRDPPARVSRLMALHRSSWQVRCAYTGTLLEDRAVDCLLQPSGSLTVPMLLTRQRHNGEPIPYSPTATPLSALTEPAQKGEEEGKAKKEKEATEAAGEVREDVFCEEECLPLNLALPSEAKAAFVRGAVGDGLADSPMNQFFLRTSYRGAGSVGSMDSSEGGGGGFTFYLDKAGGQAVQSEAERREEERQAERRSYGGLLVHYTPIAVAVAWTLEEHGEDPSAGGDNGGTRTHCGQLFHLVDPMDFLAKDTTTTSEAVAEKTVTSPSPASNVLSTRSTSVTAGGGGDSAVASVEEQQEKLCTAMVRNTSVHHARGALVYHVSAVPVVESTPALPTAALAPLRFRCLSLAPLPLLVEVTAGSPAQIVASQSQLPLVFVGKTRHSFVLAPSDTHDVQFTAHIVVPGLVDCNVFDVRVTPLLFQPKVPIVSGISRGAFLAALRAVDVAAPSGTAPTTTTISSTQVQAEQMHLHADKRGDSATSGTFEDSSIGVSAHSRTQAALRQLRSPGDASGGGGERQGRAIDRVIAQLSPPRFLSSQLVVIGKDVPALTEVHFPHLEPSVVETSERAFRERNGLYKDDITLFLKQYNRFQEVRRGWPETNRTYVYRPTVKPVARALPSQTPGGTVAPSANASFTGLNSEASTPAANRSMAGTPCVTPPLPTAPAAPALPVNAIGSVSAPPPATGVAKSAMEEEGKPPSKPSSSAPSAPFVAGTAGGQLQQPASVPTSTAPPVAVGIPPLLPSAVAGRPSVRSSPALSPATSAGTSLATTPSTGAAHPLHGRRPPPLAPLLPAAGFSEPTPTAAAGAVSSRPPSAVGGGGGGGGSSSVGAAAQLLPDVESVSVSASADAAHPLYASPILSRPRPGRLVEAAGETPTDVNGAATAVSHALHLPGFEGGEEESGTSSPLTFSGGLPLVHDGADGSTVCVTTTESAGSPFSGPVHSPPTMSEMVVGGTAAGAAAHSAGTAVVPAASSDPFSSFSSGFPAASESEAVEKRHAVSAATANATTSILDELFPVAPVLSTQAAVSTDRPIAAFRTSIEAASVPALPAVLQAPEDALHALAKGTAAGAMAEGTGGGGGDVPHGATRGLTIFQDDREYSPPAVSHPLSQEGSGPDHDRGEGMEDSTTSTSSSSLPFEQEDDSTGGPKVLLRRGPAPRR